MIWRHCWSTGLHELLLALELEQIAFRDIELNITGGTRLGGTVQAMPLASMDKPIKAVTFNELDIHETSLGLEATIVFDV